MTELQFVSEIEEIVEMPAGSLNVATQLESIDDWTSMAIIAFIAMVDSKLGISVEIEALSQCITIGDLKCLCGGKVQ